METHDRNDDALASLLRFARDLPPSGEHLDEDTLQGWTDETLTAEERDSASRHLSRCDLCAMAVTATASLNLDSNAGAPRADILAFRIRHFSKLVPRQDDNALAAASAVSRERPFESFREGQLTLSLIVTEEGEVVATLTEGDAPMDAVPVRLVRLAANGSKALVASGATDSEGRVSFGSLSDLPWPGFGEWHELHVPTSRKARE